MNESGKRSDENESPYIAEKVYVGPRFTWFIAFCIVGVVAIGIFLATPRIGGPHMPARRTMSLNDMRQMVIAMHNYESENGHFPPPYSVDENGRPLHSWRVLILPYMGYSNIYEAIDKTKPWDDPVNLKFHDAMPDLFRDLRDESEFAETTTTYVALVGEQTIWRPADETGFNDCIDGTSMTIALIQSDTFRVNWMSPNDPTFDKIFGAGSNKVGDVISDMHGGGSNIAMVDGSTRFLSIDDLTMDTFEAMVTMNGQEILDID